MKRIPSGVESRYQASVTSGAGGETSSPLPASHSPLPKLLEQRACLLYCMCIKHIHISILELDNFTKFVSLSGVHIGLCSCPIRERNSNNLCNASVNVGWVERSETQHRLKFDVGFRSSNASHLRRETLRRALAPQPTSIISVHPYSISYGKLFRISKLLKTLSEV